MNIESEILSVHAEHVRILKQEDVIDEFIDNGYRPWTVVYEEAVGGGLLRKKQILLLVQLGQGVNLLKDLHWDHEVDDGMPLLRGSAAGASYARSLCFPEFEHLIMCQRFNSVVPDELNVSEEFKFLMNLWCDPKTGNYYQIKNSGDKELAVKLFENRVEVRTSILKKYMAARRMDAVLCGESVVTVECGGQIQDLSAIECEEYVQEEQCRWSREVLDVNGACPRVLSIIAFKSVLTAPSQDKCQIWPFDEIRSDEYAKFIVGEDEDGGLEFVTCDPKGLSGHFYNVPGMPSYYTPVFFKREVLLRYYNSGECDIRDGSLSCGELWSVKLNNSSLEYVSVNLGDIGLCIPRDHWDHWKAYNIAPVGNLGGQGNRGLSSAQSPDGQNPEYSFKKAYVDLQILWKKAWGWPLHRPQEGLDASVLSRLRVPVNNTEAEFRRLLVDLALTLIDSLNEKQLVKGLSAEPEEKGIAKLDRFLKEYGYKSVDADIATLKTVQGMRSKIGAHSLGKSGEKYLNDVLGDSNYQQYFAQLLSDCNTVLLNLEKFAQCRADASGN